MSQLQDPAENQPTEKQLLMERAKLMGLNPSNNSSVESLKAKIAEKMEGRKEVAESADTDLQPANPLAGQDEPAVRKTLRQHLYDENMKLVRVRIQNLDPKKASLPGEVFTVANEHLGTIRKFIPYGEASEGGYHIPYILYLNLVERQFQNIRTVKDKRTNTTRVVTSWAKEFAIEVLPPLTKVELQQLATAQIAAGTVEVQQ